MAFLRKEFLADPNCATLVDLKTRKSLHVFEISTAKTAHRAVFFAQDDTRPGEGDGYSLQKAMPLQYIRQALHKNGKR